MRLHREDFLLGASYSGAGYTLLDVLLANGRQPLTTPSSYKLHRLLAKEFGVANSAIEAMAVPLDAKGPVNIYRGRLPVMFTEEEVLDRVDALLRRCSGKLRRDHLAHSINPRHPQHWKQMPLRRSPRPPAFVTH